MGWGAFFGGDGFTGDIREVNTDFQILTGDGYIGVTGTVNLTLPDIDKASNGVFVDCISGVVTMLGDAPIEGPTVLTTSMKAYFIPLAASWRQL